jgi:hypothetical protein
MSAGQLAAVPPPMFDSERDFSNGLWRKSARILITIPEIGSLKCRSSVVRFSNGQVQSAVRVELFTALNETCFRVGRVPMIRSAVSSVTSGWRTSLVKPGALLTISTSVADMACGKEMISSSVSCLAAFARLLRTSICSKRWTVTRFMRCSERLKATLTNERGTGLRAPERSRCIQRRGSFER